MSVQKAVPGSGVFEVNNKVGFCRISIAISDTPVTRLHKSGHLKNIDMIKWHPKLDVICSGAYDGTVRLWDLRTSRVHPKQTVLEHFNSDSENARKKKSNVITSMDWREDGQLLATTAKYSNYISIWNNNGELTCDLGGSENRVKSVKWNTNGTQLVSCGQDTVVWDFPSRNVIRHLDHSTERVLMADWLDEKTFAIGVSREIHLYGNGEIISIAKEHTENINTLKWCPHKLVIASTALDGTVRVWPLLFTSGSVYTFRGHTSYIHTVKWKPYDPYSMVLASACFDIIKMWDTVKGAFLFDLSIQPRASYCNIEFSPDGKYIAGGTYRGRFCVWDSETGQLVHQITGRDSIEDIAWNSRGDKISIAVKRHIYVFDVRKISNSFSTAYHYLR